MKHWKETSDVLARILRLAGEGREAAVATVVRVEGSSYRRAGAKFLVEDDGATAGSISGGCLEADVGEVALQVMRSGAPTLLRYETGGDDSSVFSLGLGCGGTVEIFVQRATAPESLDAKRKIVELLRSDRPFSVATVLKGEAAGRVSVRLTGASEREEDTDVFVEAFEPPPSLMIFGAGDDAIPLCSYSSDAGFRVTIIDHRPAALTAARFPGAFRLVARRSEEGLADLSAGPRAFAVVKTHSFAHDREWVRHLLAAGVPYVGLLGPRSRGAKLLTQIGAADESLDGRIFTPVGLDLGAEGPEQVAIAIVAELLAVHASRRPGSLRGKDGEEAIHAG